MRRARWWDLASKLRPEQLQRYLREHGWSEHRQRGGRASTFEKDGIDLLLPLTLAVGDYSLRVRDVISALAEGEGKAPGELVAEISEPASDVLDFRLTGPGIGPGTIALLEGVDALQRSAEVFAAAYASALSPRPSHRWQPPPELETYLAGLRLATAEPSSHVVRVLAPVDTAVDAESRVRTGRQVTSMLARALQRLSDQAGGAADLTSTGVSAELCFALSELMGGGRLEVELVVAFSWSGARPIASDAPREVVFPAGSASRLEQIGEALGGVSGFRLMAPPPWELERPAAYADRAPLAPLVRGTTLMGYVTALSENGYVMIRADVDDRERTVRVDLDDEVMLHRAVQAFDAAKPVQVTGDLQDRPRIPRLQNVTDLRVV